MKIQYMPSKDKLTLQIHPIKGRANRKLGPYELWWDEEGNICALAITKYTEELEEFQRNLKVIQLGGIWRGVKITDEDIKEARKGASPL